MTYISSHLKDMNRQCLYSLLLSRRRTSKAELARLSGISAPTVIKIISHFENLGLIVPDDEAETSAAVGRRPQWLRFHADRYYSVGVLHEGHSIRAGLVNLCGEVRGAQCMRAGIDPHALFTDALPTLIHQLIVSCGVTTQDLLGIGLGLPAVFNPSRDSISFAQRMGIPNEFCIRDGLSALSALYGLPVLADNDIHYSVVGEYAALRLQDSDLIYVSLGEGVGCGVMLGGRLRRGQHGQCGQIGHMPLSAANHRDNLEKCLSAAALRARFGDLASADRAEIIRYISPILACALHNIQLCYDCGGITLGGETVQLLGDELFSAVHSAMAELSPFPVSLHKQVSPAPGVIGAAMAILRVRQNDVIEGTTARLQDFSATAEMKNPPFMHNAE